MELIRAGDGRSHAEHRGVLETRRTTSSSLKQECMCTRCRRSAPGDKLYCSDVMTTCKDGSAPAADEVFVKCVSHILPHKFFAFVLLLKITMCS
jgi:hypothetical protein